MAALFAVQLERIVIFDLMVKSMSKRKIHLRVNRSYDDPDLGRFEHSACGRGFQWNNASDRECITRQALLVTCKECIKKMHEH